MGDKIRKLQALTQVGMEV